MAARDTLAGLEKDGGKGAATAPGLNVIGDFTADIGLGEAASSTLNAMLGRGIPLSYAELRYRFERRGREPDPRWLKLPRGSIYPINFLYYNLDQLMRVTDVELEQVTAGKYTIAYWVWELPRIPVQLLAQFGRVDEVWVPSRFVQSSMTEVTDVPVLVFPHPIEVVTSPQPARAQFGLPDDRYLFLFTFSGTSSFARKNPWGLIEAFERAFGRTGKTGPLLVLKAHHLDLNPTLRSELRRAVRRVNGVLLEDSMTRRQVNDLLACADAYVSLHRSEGFGLGMAESMYLGKPVIATHYSANVDYMTAENSYPVSYSLREVTADDHRHEPHLVGHYEPGQLWAEPNLEVAAQLMSQLYQTPEEGRERGARAAQDIRAYCGPSVVSGLIEDRLATLGPARKRPPSVRLLRHQASMVVARHKEAWDAWERARHLTDCVPLAHRAVVGPLAASLARLPLLGHLMRGIQFSRFRAQLLAAERDLQEITLEEAQVLWRAVTILAESSQARDGEALQANDQSRAASREVAGRGLAERR